MADFKALIHNQNSFWNQIPRNENVKFCLKSKEVCMCITEFFMMSTASTSSKLRILDSIVVMIWVCWSAGFGFDSRSELFIQVFVELVIQNSSEFIRFQFPSFDMLISERVLIDSQIWEFRRWISDFSWGHCYSLGGLFCHRRTSLTNQMMSDVS